MMQQASGAVEKVALIVADGSDKGWDAAKDDKGEEQ